MALVKPKRKSIGKMNIVSYTPSGSLFRPNSKGYENTLGNFPKQLLWKIDCGTCNNFSINAVD